MIGGTHALIEVKLSSGAQLQRVQPSVFSAQSTSGSS